MAQVWTMVMIGVALLSVFVLTGVVVPAMRADCVAHGGTWVATLEGLRCR